MKTPATRGLSAVATGVATLLLPAGAVEAQTIRGQVIYPSANTARSYTATYAPIYICRRGATTCRRTMTDSRGGFVVSSLRPGAYVIRIQWRNKRYSTPVTVGAGQTRYLRIVVKPQ